MAYLLDTHSFLWFINGDEQLSAAAQKEISNTDTIKYISIASFWEIAIKISLDKLSLDIPYKDLYQQVIVNGFEILPITFEHTIGLTNLELYHRDPFDRLIIVQAITENHTIISKDKNFSGYKGVRLLW